MPRVRNLSAVPDSEEQSLGEFEGRQIEAIKLIVTRAGDGLSKSMDVAPRLLEIGDKTGILILGEVAKVRHEVHKYEKGEEDLEGLDRVQVIEAEGAMLLPADSPELKQVRALLAELARREKVKKDAAAGQGVLEGTEN